MAQVRLASYDFCHCHRPTTTAPTPPHHPHLHLAMTKIGLVASSMSLCPRFVFFCETSFFSAFFSAFFSSSSSPSFFSLFARRGAYRDVGCVGIGVGIAADEDEAGVGTLVSGSVLLVSGSTSLLVSGLKGPYWSSSESYKTRFLPPHRPRPTPHHHKHNHHRHHFYHRRLRNHFPNGVVVKLRFRTCPSCTMTSSPARP